jgi:hypothetical protein
MSGMRIRFYGNPMGEMEYPLFYSDIKTRLRRKPCFVPEQE